MQEMLWLLTNTGGYPGLAKQAQTGVNPYFETALLGTLPNRLPH